MKTLHLLVMAILAVVFLVIPTGKVYAPCALNVTSCGPPPGVTVSAGTDSQFYEKNDTIFVRGHVYLENYTSPILIHLVDPQNKIVQNFTTPVTNYNTFSLKIGANFKTTGLYQLITCLGNWCDRSHFKYIAGPYKLSFNNQVFVINYKTFADLAGMDVDINHDALIIHIANATSTGQLLIVDLPRSLIDAKIGNRDADFKVLVGQIQAEKYMKMADFKEIATTNASRTLAIDIPYDPMTDEAGIWDFKITISDIPSGPSFFLASPLKQFEYGMYAGGVHCQNNLLLILKAEDGSPACVTPDTAQKLMERGWAKSPTGVSGLAMPPVGLSNLTLSAKPIILGIPFYVNAVVTNHLAEPIIYYGGCVSPLSVSLDNIKTTSDAIHCLAISKYTLGPDQSVPIQSDKIETVYNATGPDTSANAQIRFSYEVDGKQASMFTGMEIPIQDAIMIDCSTNVLLHISKIDRTVNVTKAVALAYTSPEFLSKARQYGNLSYNHFYNDWFSSESCHTYWNGTEVMFTANDKNNTRNIQVSEDINLTKVLKVKDFLTSPSK